MARIDVRFAVLLPLLAACGANPAVQVPADAENATFSLALTQAQQEGVLALVNDCLTTLTVLDLDAGLDVRAATNIVTQRDAADAECGTADDSPFATLDQLDAVAYVGDSALVKLLQYADANGYVPAGSDPVIGYFDGVAFSKSQGEGVLAVANGASFTVLDEDVGLDARAANGIMATRPFANSDLLTELASLAQVPYVGRSALTRLQVFVPTWSSCAPVGGSFEGVSFSDLQAHDALDLTNQGTFADLDVISGIGTTTANRLINARPFATVEEVGGVSGVGARLLTALRDEPSARWCPRPGATCGCHDSGSATTEPPVASSITVDGVTFDETEAAAALDILNTATRAQLRADGSFSSTAADIIEQGRSWPGIQAFGDTAGIGAATIEAVRAYAINGSWRGSGPMQTAQSIDAVFANAAAYNYSLVSFNSVFSALPTNNGFASATRIANLYDDIGGRYYLQLRRFLCDYMAESCDPFPGIHEGHRYELVHVRVEIDGGVPWLRMVETTEYRDLGCVEGYTRSCGKDLGVCFVGEQTCVAGAWTACSGNVDQLDFDPGDGLDNDCDGATDENAMPLAEVAHLPGKFYGFGINGNEGLATGTDLAMRLDVGDPMNPAIVESVDWISARWFSARAYSDGTLVSGCRTGVHFFPQPASGLAPTWTLPASSDPAVVGCMMDAQISGNLLVVAEHYSGVYAYDLSAGTPVEIWHVTPEFPGAIEVIGDYVFALGTWDLLVYSLSSPSGSPPVATLRLDGGYTHNMRARGTDMLAITSTAGLHLIDVSTPTAPVTLSLSDEIYYTNVEFAGDLIATVTSSTSRMLRVLDISNPAAPELVAEAVVPNPTGVLSDSAIRGVRFDGTTAWVFGGTGLHVFELALP